MRYRATLVAGALVFALSATLAQEQTPPKSPQPGPEAKRLGVFVGKWIQVGDVKAGPMGPGGKATGSATCEWVSDGFGVLCRESMPVPRMGRLTDVYLMAYDDEAKSYVYTQVSNAPGAVWIGRGTVDGDTWVWNIDTTMDGKPGHVRFTITMTSPDSFDFKNEMGTSADSMTVMMDGKETRVKGTPTKSSATLKRE